MDVTGLLSTSRIPTHREISFRASNFRLPHDHDCFYHHDHIRRNRRKARAKFTILRAATTDNQNESDGDSNSDETDMDFNESTNVDDASTPSPPSSSENYHVIKKNNPKSKRKPHSDNRDQLPFVVQMITPDPYTRPEVAKERARKNTERDRQTTNATQQQPTSQWWWCCCCSSHFSISLWNDKIVVEWSRRPPP